MATLELTNYSRKGIHAYLCPLEISVRSYAFKRGHFINGTPVDDEKQRFYQGKSATCTIDLARLPNGYYEYKEAVGHKSISGYLQIENGEIVKEWDTSEEMLDHYYQRNGSKTPSF